LPNKRCNVHEQRVPRLWRSKPHAWKHRSG